MWLVVYYYVKFLYYCVVGTGFIFRVAVIGYGYGWRVIVNFSNLRYDLCRNRKDFI